MHPVQPLTVVITGASRGLGRAMVKEFTSLGHTVCGCARTKCEIDVLSEIYPNNKFNVVDITSDAAVSTWAQAIIERHGAPDFLLNNAAVISTKAPLWEIDEHAFSQQVDTNLKGPANVIRHFVPKMIERKRGVVVNFASRWGHNIEKYIAPYCATKWAVVALSRSLADELKRHGIAVIALNPGIVNTDMLRTYLGHDALPNCFYPTPSEWARAAVPFILTLGLKDTGQVRHIYYAHDPAQHSSKLAVRPIDETRL